MTVTKEQVLAYYENGLQLRPPAVYGFFRRHRPLSNFHLEPFMWNGILWPASENAYMAAKINPDNPDGSFADLTPAEAQKKGQTVKLVEGWDGMKSGVMLSILLDKFRQCPTARECLISTGRMHLEESNWWGDKFWGTVDGEGRNQLGKALMTVREWI